MAISAVYLGHWRALEEIWLKEFNHLTHTGTVAVITAGSLQSLRLQSMVPGSVAGAGFFPGIPHLARALSDDITLAPVTRSQSIALAYHAGYSCSFAPSAGSFFERLIDSGVGPETFRIVADSIREPGSEVGKTAARFMAYGTKRKAEHPLTADCAIFAGPSRPRKFDSYMIYGFYDLNPGQRNYIRKLAESADIVWLSPVHPSHHWRSAFQRTLEFLRGLNSRDSFHRVDGGRDLSSIAQFAENLLTGKALQNNDGISLKLCGSGSAFTKAVAGEVKRLTSLHGETAVMATGSDAQAIRMELYCCGVPCASDLTVRACELPWGRLILRLNSLEDNNFHHSDIQRMLATGTVLMSGTPDPDEYAERAMRTGARFGIKKFRETGFPFAERIVDHFSSLPPWATPAVLVKQLVSLLKDLTAGSLPEVFSDDLLGIQTFRSTVQIDHEIFRKMTSAALEGTVVLGEKSAGGVQILSPEKLRGVSFKSVILTGMEEGSFPSKAQSDPRLPLEMKVLLQMPSPDNRETEEAFLLRQAFEAAQENVVIIARHSDLKGNPMALSPFLSPLRVNPGLVRTEIIPSMPLLTLDLPPDPPFFRESVETQKERLFFRPEEPSPAAVHCGMIGGGLFTGRYINASMLEKYARRKFTFLTENLWKVSDRKPFPVSSEPEPMIRGNLIHTCVERALEEQRSVRTVVEEEAEKSDIEALLGSRVLAGIWKEHTVQGIEDLKNELMKRGWPLLEKEKELRGEIAGYPARGRIDLIFRDSNGSFILADLKTGRPKDFNSGNMIERGHFQLPFYTCLALQNGFSPIKAVCYIHLEGNGTVTLKELGIAEIRGIMPVFEEKVRAIVEDIRNGCFPFEEEESWESRAL